MGWPYATMLGALRGEYLDLIVPSISATGPPTHSGKPTLDDPRGLHAAVPQESLDHVDRLGGREAEAPPVRPLPVTLLYAGGVPGHGDPSPR